MSRPKFTVAICGGGIGGLMSAIAIAKLSWEKDIKIDIYESTTKFSEIGAGIGFWLRSWNIMRELGLDASLEGLLDQPVIDLPPCQSFEFRKSDQEKGFSFFEFIVPAGTIGFHRSQFLEILASQLDPQCTTTHFSKRLISYVDATPGNPNEPVQLSFADGTTATADVLIGCDGIHSTVRRQLLETGAQRCESTGTKEELHMAERLRASIEPVWTGFTTYRTVIPREKILENSPDFHGLSRPMFCMGKNMNIVAYPIAKRRFVNFVAFKYDPSKVGTVYDGPTSGVVRDKYGLKEQYEDWENDIKAVVECVENPTFWVIKSLNPLPISASGRVALLGDAAHAMSPYQGSGAGQAVEDAYILASILSDSRTTLSTLPTALKIYEEVRLPHANEAMRRSKECSDILTCNHPKSAWLADASPNDIDVGKLWDVGYHLLSIWKWAWTTNIDNDRERATQMLKDRTM